MYNQSIVVLIQVRTTTIWIPGSAQGGLTQVWQLCSSFLVKRLLCCLCYIIYKDSAFAAHFSIWLLLRLSSTAFFTESCFQIFKDVFLFADVSSVCCLRLRRIDPSEPPQNPHICRWRPLMFGVTDPVTDWCRNWHVFKLDMTPAANSCPYEAVACSVTVEWVAHRGKQADG